jgi:inward rectifier potassium channel
MAELPTYPRAVPREPGDQSQVLVKGARQHVLSDLYYRMLRTTWPRLFLTFVALYVVVNALFAVAYLITGGIEGARPGSYPDCFFFSVQTMATIGYGAMYPKTPVAHALVTSEALIGLLGVAMATGILFSKFARPESRVIFSDVAVITRREGLPSLLFRIANERRNHVVEATVTLYLVRNEVTAEGEAVRRWHELPLSRKVSPIFALTWTVFHPIDEASKLFGETAESLAQKQAEIVVTMTGIDATLSSAIHARHSYVARELRFGEKFVDIFALADGKRAIDLTRFHETEPE